MNIWFIILMVFIVALILGPMAMLRPNPAQKRKEQLRLNASQQGIRFAMRRLPAQKTDMEQPPVLPVYFLPPSKAMQSLPEWVLIRTTYEHEGNFYKDWNWHTEVRPSPAIEELLAGLMSQLPASVAAITQGKSGTCVFWREAGGEEALTQVIDLLRRLEQAAAEGLVNPLP